MYVDRIIDLNPRRFGLIFFFAAFSCPSLSFAQESAPAASGNASAVVLGSCNVVQQNVTAAESATIINEINCVPEKAEDSFLLRYLWLDATNSSFMVAGRFDPALARLLPANPVVVRNPVFEKVQEIVTRFGDAVNSNTESLKSGNTYAIMGKGKGNDITGEGLHKAPPAILKKLRIYAGEQDIIWPDVPSLRAVIKTEYWPSKYRLTYCDSEDLNKPQTSLDFQNAAISSALLFGPVSAKLLMEYWNSIAELEALVTKKEFSFDEFANLAATYDERAARVPIHVDNYKVELLKNRSIDAMLYFGEKYWPDDFLFAFGNAYSGVGCDPSYKFGFYALPRRIFALVAVIEPRYKDLQIENISYLVDQDEQLRLLRRGTEAINSPPGVITVKKGEMAVVPLRIELRYDLQNEDLPFSKLLNLSLAKSVYKKITNTTLSSFVFKGRGSVNLAETKKGVTEKPLRTIFSKSIASFRPPETDKINPTYIFGPTYDLKSITIKGTAVTLRSAPAAAVAFLGETGIGSCPFLFVSDGVADPSRVGRVLIGASKKELARVDDIKLPREARTFFLSEQEPEVTYLESVVVKHASSGEERLVASNLVIHPGQTREFRIPEEFYGDAVLKIRGYYIPLRFDQSAEGDGAPSGQAPN